MSLSISYTKKSTKLSSESKKMISASKIAVNKAIKESNSCTVKGQTAKTVEKTGSFTIKSLETILVNVNLN